MGCKVTLVVLFNDTLGVTREFEVMHAARLLAMPNNGGWRLPEKSKYTFNGHDIEFRRDKADNRAAKE